MHEGTDLLGLEDEKEWTEGGTLRGAATWLAAMIGVHLIGAVIVVIGIVGAWALVASAFGPSAAALGHSLGLG